MKAKIIGTTTEFEVEGIIMNGIGYVMEDVEVIPTITEPSTDPDWEQRRYELAKAAMQAQLSLQPSPDLKEAVEYSVYVSDLMISELQKPRT